MHTVHRQCVAEVLLSDVWLHCVCLCVCVFVLFGSLDFDRPSWERDGSFCVRAGFYLNVIDGFDSGTICIYGPIGHAGRQTRGFIYTDSKRSLISVWQARST